ncbi:methyltransferase-like protein 25 [Lampris incognitus]|uniref:methyltransferase-like protein 25 n=1 Tax=Lampris incognitus TaxID=2546036 RepID=UPI0024B5CDA3|nr:methyltransferase-like protein 25 [Lampris incognitus]
MASAIYTLSDTRRRIDEVKRFLSVVLNIANAHTVEFYTHNVWGQFIAVPPDEVLLATTSATGQTGEPELNRNERRKTTFGFCDDTKRLVDVHELLEAAKAHSLPGLGVCMTRDELLQSLRQNQTVSPPTEEDAILDPDGFMNSKKSHEVQSMSEVVASLARQCRVKQVIDVGSGKGYLCSFLSMQHGLQVYGIDSSSTNTHGAHERNRKLKKFSRAYQKRSKAARNQKTATETAQDEFTEIKSGKEKSDDNDLYIAEEGERQVFQVQSNTAAGEKATQKDERELEAPSLSLTEEVDGAANKILDSNKADSKSEALFLSVLSVDAIESTTQRAPPSKLSFEERERRKRENLERKARNRPSSDAVLFSPLTSYVTAETELRELISELVDAVMVGLHTCGDLASSTLRMFVAKPELAAVCSVGCCYHLLSEEYEPAGPECPDGVWGFPLSQYLREQAWFCGRNARMSACLALERVSVGQGIQMESLFYRAVLHVILRDRYSSFKSEKRVGNVYSKAKSFANYVRRALSRLDLDDSKLSDGVIQDYLNTYRPRMDEMHAFNMLKVILAPCVEGLILLDRLCYLKEQEDVSFSALVQLFDPLLSPRCYAVVGVKKPGIVQTHKTESHIS